jgi:phosphopantetheine--protein transferase-like protein
MRLPFEPALRIGTDLARVDRFVNPHLPDLERLVRLNKKWMTNWELRHLFARFKYLDTPESIPTKKLLQGDLVKLGRYVAGRWAAKEAAKKAWGASLISFRDLEVDAEGDGRPIVRCFVPGHRLSESHQSDLKVTLQEADLSISHDGSYALACVLAGPLHPDLRNAFEKIKREAEAKVKGSKRAPRDNTELLEDKRGLSPAFEEAAFYSRDPVFDNHANPSSREPDDAAANTITHLESNPYEVTIRRIHHDLKIHRQQRP